MEIKISIVSEDQSFALQQSQSLRTWIENDEDLEYVKVKQERSKLKEDEAGGVLLAILQVFVSSAFEPIAKTIQVWLQERTKRSAVEFSVELEEPSGKRFKINSKNIGESDKALITEIINRFEGNQNYDYKITQ